jgi:hypothetical protein
MTRVLLVLGALAVLAQPAIGQEATEATVLEPKSKVPFPMHLGVPGHGEQHVLTGTGLRTKTFLKVKVYAFGLYVDEEAAHAALGTFAGQNAKELEENDAFYAQVLEMGFPMTLRLVMTRDVGGDDMADAFDGALRPRVQRAAAEMNMPGGEAALEEFRTYFSVEEMTKESELVFTCADGTLMSQVRGEVMPELDSPALCWALFDVYLGEDPISGDGKKKVVYGFPRILQTM